MYLTAVVDLFVCMFSTGFRFFSCIINLVYTCIHLPFVIWYFLHLVHISKTFMIISKTTANSICQMQHFYMLSCCQHALHAFSLKGENKNEFLHPWKSSRHKSIYKWADFLCFSVLVWSLCNTKTTIWQKCFIYWQLNTNDFKNIFNWKVSWKN